MLGKELEEAATLPGPGKGKPFHFGKIEPGGPPVANDRWPFDSGCEPGLARKDNVEQGA